MKSLLGLKQAALALCIVLFAVSIGWLADVIADKDYDLFGGLHTILVTRWDQLLFVLGVIALLSVAIYRLRDELLPVKQLEQHVSFDARKGLLLFLSYDKEGTRFDSQRRELLRVDKVIPLTGNLQDDKDSEVFNNVRWNGQQLLRAIAPHSGTLEKVYLIGSQQSKVQVPLWHELFAFYFPSGLTVKVLDAAVDFEDLDAVTKAISGAIDWFTREGLKAEEIMVDVTGGQKIVSIGAALSTLHRRQLMFQYVNEPGKVTAYNAVTMSLRDIG